MSLMLSAKPVKVCFMMSTRICAEKFRRKQSDPRKAKQVYLNTLAVAAVEHYLNSLGWVTSHEQSDSWNPIMQTLMDVADLEVVNYGKIECRVVLLDQQELIVPPEVQSDRIAYIAVKISSSLRKCELLGFIPEVTAESTSLAQLHGIENLPAYLREYKQLQDDKVSESITRLSQWWEGIVDGAWQLVEQIFPPNTAGSFRSPHQLQELPQSSIDRLSQGVSRVKLLDLGQGNNTIPIALILQLVNNAQGEIDISAKICPINTSLYLPQGLEIMILDDSQRSVLQATARNNNENIEFLFSGQSGEFFSIKASLNESHIVETFVI
ncbi:Protein of unknown function (DUF1822) [Xenococcus sp. PCC 7305]|uniref:DUF1822 family protein n=1 Tax=Xenococcus sp. PCC 7305 TaxID=102125 RepID=UPI0002ABE2D4|nr:DUF1822 family protein [Xenococcus sp. PCC 7305]ELS03241.1 Protein of unknown function (DUF1822) [Xenococcus sp. PCC 7305]